MRRKNLTAVIISILFILPLPLLSQAQGFQRNRLLKNTEEGRGLAISNTILPVVTGVGAAYLFKNRTIRTAGSALAVYGLMMGPSAGNFYAEDYFRGGMGAAVRAGAGYFLLRDTTRELMGEKVAGPLGWDNKDVSLKDTKVLVGAGIFLGSMIYNVLSVSASVAEHNGSMRYSVYVTPAAVKKETIPVLTARFRF